MERTFVISGRVQGVGFRWWTRSHAERLGLAGSVRNRHDGTVEVQVRGDPAAVQELQRHLAQGPPTARVDRVSAEEGGAVDGSEFTIIG